MKRLGKFSGKIYNEEEIKNMEECGLCISDSEANDEMFIQNRHIKDLKDCLKCFSCPLSQKTIIGDYKNNCI